MDFEKKYLVKEEHTLHAKKEGLENWAISRAELNDRRFQQIEEDIKKIRDNELHHLELENMPAIREILEGLYTKNKELRVEIKKAFKIASSAKINLWWVKVALVILFILSIY